MTNIKKETAVNFDEALRMVLNSTRRLGTKRVSIYDNGALNRILAEDIVADDDQPPVNESLRDGFACHREDLANKLKVIETIPAGTLPQKVIKQNECARIMTGAILPEGADCVIMVEDSENIKENTIRFTGRSNDINISFKGEYIKKGDIVLRSGSRIGAAQIAVLASNGCVNPLVSIRPRVGIIATGSELVEPDQKPAIFQIRSSNGFQLAAQAAAIGAVVKNYGIVADTKNFIDQIFKQALTENDIVISSGGTSEGEYDFIQEIFYINNVNLLFERIGINPGRPMVFGVANGICCFGMPGTPVSAFIMFELLTKPLFFSMMGHDFKPVVVRMELDETIKRKNTEKDLWLPTRFTENSKVTSLKYHGSGYTNALCQADGLLYIPSVATEISKGTIVNIRLI